MGVVSPLGVTADDEEARRLASLGRVEQLEAFAVLRVAASLGLPAIGVYAIANPVGRDGSAAWRAHRAQAEEAAAAAAASLLAG